MRGYTLIELLIVIAILGIASALLVPHMVNSDTMNGQAAVRLMIGDLCFAQSDALAHQEFRRVHFYEDGRGYCLVRLTTTAEVSAPFDESSTTPPDYVTDPMRVAGGGGDYIIDFTVDTRFAGVTISAVNIDGGGRDVTYDSLGGTVMAGTGDQPGMGGTITVKSGTDDYVINIQPFTGKLTVN
ncbi:MAG: type II secretion system GspH family protein [Phycisphaerales bacterium]|nr:type II secretion system GspH family protein [Phycisphaerales bacterium]MCI0630714.1 type II secretion system GspH family protein [Phycisphaerales bacterium]MCI0677322.1 type II secretion system GspH family protein [Phycisphaerales bacterium]